MSAMIPRLPEKYGERETGPRSPGQPAGWSAGAGALAEPVKGPARIPQPGRGGPGAPLRLSQPVLGVLQLPLHAQDGIGPFLLGGAGRADALVRRAHRLLRGGD